MEPWALPATHLEYVETSKGHRVLISGRVYIRGCQNTVSWPYSGQNTDIFRNMSQNIRP